MGQMQMGGSRLRPFCCVGIAYFVIAVAVPSMILMAYHIAPFVCICSLLAALSGIRSRTQEDVRDLRVGDDGAGLHHVAHADLPLAANQR